MAGAPSPIQTVTESRNEAAVIRFIIRRLLLSIPVLLGVVFIVFLNINPSPSARTQLQLPKVSPTTIARS